MNEITTTKSDLVLVDNKDLDQHPAAVYLASLANGSKRTMRQALDTIAGLLVNNADAAAVDWSRVRYQHTQAIRARLAEDYSPATVNKMLCALRGTLKAAWQLGLMSAEDYHKAASVESVNGETVLAGRDLSPGEIAALMAACENDTSPAGARDAAIIALMYVWGLRRAEVITLDLADYDTQAERLLIRGKRNKQRYSYPQNGEGRALADWLKVRGSAEGALFMPITKGGNIQPRRMADQVIYNMLEKRAGEAGVAKFSPHDLRRTCVGDYLDAGVDLATVSKIVGHESVNTTARYDRRPEEAKKRAAAKLHVPYSGRK